MLGWVFGTIGSLFNTGTPKKVAFIGPAVSGAGKTLVDHLKSGQYVVKKGSIYPEIVEDVKLGEVGITAFIAPANGDGRRLFQEEVTKEPSWCHGIVYLISLEYDALETYKDELETLLSKTSPTPVLVLALHETSKPSEEQITADLGLAAHQSDRVKLAVTALSRAVEHEGTQWLSERLA